MLRLKNISVRNKLFLLSSTLLIAVFAVSATGYRGITQLNRLSSVNEQQVEAIRTISTIERSYDTLRAVVLRSWVAAQRHDQPSQDEAATELQTLSESLPAELSRIATFPLEPDAQQALARVTPLAASYIALARETSKLAVSGEWSRAGDSLAQFQVAFASVGEGLQELGLLVRGGTSFIKAQSEETAAQATRYTLIVQGVALVLAMGLSWLFASSIVTPLQNMTHAARRIAFGEIHQQIDHYAKDETGVLASAFRELISYIQGIADAAEHVSRGDLTVTITPRSTDDVLSHNFANMVAQLRQMNTQIQEGTKILSAAIAQILSSVSQVAHSTAETASAVTQTATTMDEVKQIASMATDKAKVIAEHGEQAVSVSATGERALAEADEGLQRINEKMESIADSVIHLGENSQAIADIIEAVDQVAEQSSLLAINAAIEASNAGEVGKGFAVIARSVKALADQSRQATSQVKAILKDIQKASHITVLVTEQGTKSVKVGVAQSRQAGESIRILSGKMADAAQAMTQIALSSEQQLVGVEQVVSALSSIRKASTQNADEMRTIQAATQNLHSVGAALTTLVECFQLTAPGAESADTAITPSLSADSPLATRHSYRSHSMFRFVTLIVFLTLGVVRAEAIAEDSTELTAPTSVAGEDTTLLQEIPSVYGASKYEQKVTDAPSSVTIITNEEIKRYGYRTLADLLQGVNGFYVTSDRNYNYIGARGFSRPGDYNARVLLLVDGHRLNDNIYDQGAIGREEVIDLDLVEQVEIIRGPSSSLYGTNAFFGVINVVTKRGRDINGAEVSGETGSFGSHLGRFTYGKRFQNGLEMLLSGSWYDSDGHPRLFFREFKDPLANKGIVRRNDDDGFYKLFAKLSLADFTFQGGLLSREKRVPTAPYGSVFNRKATAKDEHVYIDLKYQHEFEKLFDLSARLYYDRYYYNAKFFYDYGTPDEPQLTLNRDTAVGDWWGTEITLARRLWDKHKVTAGGEFRYNVRQSQRNYDLSPFTSYLDDLREDKIWALYLQDEFSLLDNLILNVGARYDHYDSFGGTFNPRLALIYHWGKTSIKLLYGQAFRAPTVAEQFYVTSNLYKAGVGLKPEDITTYEVVLERYFADHWRAALAGYYYTIDGLISQTTDPADGKIVNRNLDSINAKGIELEVEGKLASGLQARFGYSVQDNTNDETDKILSNSPRHMVKIGVSVPLWSDHVYGSIESRYMSKRYTLGGQVASGHVVTNVTLFTEEFVKGLELSASLYNLFDTHYGDPGSGEHRQNVIDRDGRTFWLRMKYAF